MNKIRTGTGWLSVIVSLSLSIFFTACQSLPADSRHIWIDYPYGNEVFPAGYPIPLQAHAYAESGVAEVLCAVDGVPYHQGAPDLPGEKFSQYAAKVTINQPGDHLLSVTAFDTEGGASAPAFVSVRINGSEETPTKAETPTATETVPTATTAAADTPAPQEATATLAIASPKAPPDREPPWISQVSHSPSKIWNFHTCGEVSAVVTATVSDASAISKVTIRFRVVKGGEVGSWVERNMSGSGGTYQITLGPDQITQSMPSYRGWLEYSIYAEDVHGNKAQSGTGQIGIGDCLI